MSGRVAHAAGLAGAIAWAKLRDFAQIMLAVLGNFSHPTLRWSRARRCPDYRPDLGAEMGEDAIAGP